MSLQLLLNWSSIRICPRISRAKILNQNEPEASVMTITYTSTDMQTGKGVEKEGREVHSRIILAKS